MERKSELPDDVLIRILSFLPVEEIARAKLVSKAWQKLSEFSFLPPLTFEQPPRHYNYSVSSYIDSVDSSLKLHYQSVLSLSRLRLRLDLDVTDLDLIASSRSQIGSWIEAALERKVGQLDLRFFRNPKFDYYTLPAAAKVFAAGTITVLCLEGFRLELPRNTNINLPALRKLRLRHNQCEEQESVPKLISNFPLIRDLEISRCLPWQKIHASELARTITDLRLEDCFLEICEDVNIDLPALRKLRLSGIEYHDQAAIQKLISSCPLVQDLETSCCFYLQGLHVSGLVNLQRLTVTHCNELENIEIDAPSLQYLEYYNDGWPCDIVFTSSTEFLKEIVLFDYRYATEDFFESLAYRFPNLERLKVFCNLERIEISHPQLKQLDLKLYRNDIMLEIDTPNIQSLSYRGNTKSLLSAISSTNTSSIGKVIIHSLYCTFPHQFSILQSKEFFEKMRHCQVEKLNLYIKSTRRLIVPAKLRPILSPPVYNIKHLRLAVGNFCRYQCIIDRMLWMCHPQTLSISNGAAFVKVLYNKFMNKEEHPKCCTSCIIKCWRHYLEEVQIDDGESGEEIDKIMAMKEVSDVIMKSEIRFRLKWRSSLL